MRSSAEMRTKGYRAVSRIALVGALALLAATLPIRAAAQEKCPYEQLQILVPGEQPAPGTESGKTGAPLPQQVGESFTVQVRACFDDWTVRGDVEHVIRLTSTDDTALLPDALPMADGILEVEVTLNAAGSFTVTAEDLTDHEHFQATSSVITVGAPIGTVFRLAISAISSPQQVGIPVTVTIDAVDENGQRIPDESGAIFLTQQIASGEGIVSPQTINLEDGSWTGALSFFIADPDVQLHAQTADDAAIHGASNPFTVAPGAAARLLVLVPGQEIATGSSSGYAGMPAPQLVGLGFPATIMATDAYWNPTSESAQVLLVSSDPAATLPQLVQLENGQAQVTSTFGTAGLWTLSVSDAGQTGLAMMTTLPITALGERPDFGIITEADTVVAGISFTAEIRALDPRGETIPDYDAPARLSCEIGPGSVEPSQIQITGGVWRGQVTLFGAGSWPFTCTDYSTDPHLGTSEPLVVLPNEFARVEVILPGETLTGGLVPPRGRAPESRVAGQPVACSLLATDAWANPVPGIQRDLLVSTTDPYAAHPDTVRLQDGAAVFETTFFRAGLHHLLAVDLAGSGADARQESSLIKIHPGEYRKLILLAPGEELVPGSDEGKLGVALDQSISYSFDLHLLATDTWWNPRDDVEDRVGWTITDSLAELPQETTLVRGAATVPARLSTAGWQLITATNLDREDIPEARTQMRAISSGFHIQAQLNPEYVTAGERFTLSVEVTNDAGAVMQEINSRVDVRALNALTGEPGAGHLLNSTFQLLQGRRTVSQTYTGAEPIVLEITGELGQVTGVTNQIRVVAAPPSELRFEDPPGWVGGRKTTTVTARVTDRYGNGIDNIPMAFALTAGRGQLNQLDQVTNLVGNAQARYTGYSEPETGAIEAHAAGFSAALTIETALVDPDLPAGTITNYPNPFHPDEGATTIHYKLERDADVHLKLYTLSGSLVFETDYRAGDTGGSEGGNDVLWDGRNGQGDLVASGGYILQVEAEHDGESIHKMRRRIGVVR